MDERKKVEVEMGI